MKKTHENAFNTVEEVLCGICAQVFGNQSELREHHKGVHTVPEEAIKDEPTDVFQEIVKVEDETVMVKVEPEET